MDNDSLCKSIFRSGDSVISKEQFTKKWIELINNSEKSRALIFGHGGAT